MAVEDGPRLSGFCGSLGSMIRAPRPRRWRKLHAPDTSVSLQREVRPLIWDTKGRRIAVSSMPSITRHAIRSSSPIRPEHRHQHPKGEDGGDHQQAIPKELVQGDAGGDVRSTMETEHEHGHDAAGGSQEGEKDLVH